MIRLVLCERLHLKRAADTVSELSYVEVGSILLGQPDQSGGGGER